MITPRQESTNRVIKQVIFKVPKDYPIYDYPIRQPIGKEVKLSQITANCIAEHNQK